MSLRNFWTGNLQIGLVAVPVGLASARKGQLDPLVRLHRDCGTRVDGRSWCELDQRIVDDSEIVKGYKVADGQYVPLEQEEIAATDPTDTRTIEVLCTINRRLLDELQVDTGYFLTPASSPVGRKPYELFRTVLADHLELALLCRLVVRKHEWVATVRAHPSRRVLLLEKLVPDGTLVDPGDLERTLGQVALTPEELELGREVVLKRVRAKLPKGALQIVQRDRLVELVERKLAGENIIHTPPPTAAQQHTQTGDLADALRRSIRPARAHQQRSPRKAAVNR